MRSSFASPSGFLLKSPSYRQQVARRRMLVVCAILALALGAGLVGSLTAPRDEVATNASTGPFSYFPHQ
jgi:hypothetical protein